MELAVLGKMDTITFNGDYLNREDHREMGAYLLEKYKPNLIYSFDSNGSFSA
jgi:hypothetical protein